MRRAQWETGHGRPCAMGHAKAACAFVQRRRRLRVCSEGGVCVVSVRCGLLIAIFQRGKESRLNAWRRRARSLAQPVVGCTPPPRLELHRPICVQHEPHLPHTTHTTPRTPHTRVAASNTVAARRRGGAAQERYAHRTCAAAQAQPRPKSASRHPPRATPRATPPTTHHATHHPPCTTPHAA
jgi:hypothetical protein